MGPRPKFYDVDEPPRSVNHFRLTIETTAGTIKATKRTRILARKIRFRIKKAKPMR
jgi:hypothetical protein